MVVLLRASTGWVMEEHVVGLLHTAWLQLSWYHHLNVVHSSLPLSHGDELQKKIVDIWKLAQSHFSKAGAPRERLLTITAPAVMCSYRVAKGIRIQMSSFPGPGLSRGITVKCREVRFTCYRMGYLLGRKSEVCTIRTYFMEVTQMNAAGIY
uniref:Uncharacterized protein n=1 Tax=Coccidioides posadasii RMSCC 3488 TaxID=454284 RepID=A0A0J6FAH9_COCPO|nr:hypothetical protein CPAG_03578 [Coccidioides posadasii RMSCC 3488]